MKKLGLLLSVIAILLAGCVTSRMTSEKTLPDGAVIKYKAVITSFLLDFSGSDLTATLDPEGQTTIKAGAIDATGSQVGADVAKTLAELIKTMLPYIATVPAAP